MTGRIFISYRRDDSPAAAGRIYDRLLQHFGREQLFMDVDALEPGIDFVKSLDEQVSNCRAFISVIGPGWLYARDRDGKPRLDKPNDYVRVEIETALKRDVRVIPVLVDGATMPQPSDLPTSLEPLARRNAVEIAHHRFALDCDELARAIKRALGVDIPQPAGAQTAAALPALATADRKLSWAEILFSFRGRISRQQFLIGIGAMMAIFAALLFATLITVDQIFETGRYFTNRTDLSPEMQQRLTQLEKRLPTVLEIMVWWPTWALILKRLHDFGQGWAALLPFIVGDVMSAVLDFSDKDDAASQLTLFFLGLTFMLAAVKGTTGHNKYGADPRGPSIGHPTTFADAIVARGRSAALGWAVAYVVCAVAAFVAADYLNQKFGLTETQVALILAPCVTVVIFFGWFHFNRVISQGFLSSGLCIILCCAALLLTFSSFVFGAGYQSTGIVLLALMPLSLLYASWRIWRHRHHRARFNAPAGSPR